MPNQLGKWSDHVALVGGCGLQAGKENLTSYRRMDARWSKAPSQKAFTIGLTPQTEEMRGRITAVAAAYQESDALFCEEIKARGLWGCFHRDFPWKMDPTSDAFQASEDEACAAMLARVFSHGYCERLGLDVRDIAVDILCRPRVKEILLIDPRYAELPSAKCVHTTRYPGGMIYEGEWKCGKWDGKGKVSYTNGATYEGEFKDDMMHGQGRKEDADGYKYEGQWKENKKHGLFRCEYPHGHACARQTVQ